MQITTLGPLAVDDRPVRGERLVAVVRTLVAARGRAVSTGALVDAVWHGTPPEDATGAVQALVSRVRRLGLTVLAAPGGYRVPVDGIVVDAVEARRLVGQATAELRAGDATAARRCADAARQLFPEVPDAMDADHVRLFADVTAAQAQAALAGAGPLAETDLRWLAGRTPPDEPAVALLVRVLAAQGRGAEAIEAIERLRAELAERYGTDPSPVVAQAHLALLRGELAGLPPQPGAGVAGLELRGAGPGVGDVGPEVASRPTVGGAGPGVGDVGPGAASRPEAGGVEPGVAPGARRREPVRGTGLPAGWRRSGAVLVGRDGDLAAVTDALAAGPLVTVVATGGAGKTRLAAELARRAVHAGRPVYVVELAGLRVPDEVLPAVLAAVGGAGVGVVRPDLVAARPVPAADRPHVGDRPHVADRLASAARDLDGLVVLDNCEHLLTAVADVVDQLLATAPAEVAVLATSRAPLSLVGEVVHRLPALPDDAAVDLLGARARAGGAVLDWDAGRALVLCRRLDNLPLALELAAARLRHMPIDDLLAGLTDRFALLDDALRGLPERHASLWAMVDWSHELLAPADRQLLQRLAVIPAAFTAAAAARVAAAPDVRRGLATLVEQSLLVLERADDGQPRYRMLETVREYGEVRLDQAGGRETAMGCLVGWAADEAAALAASFTGPGQVAAFERCAAEQDTLVAGLRWAIGHGDEAAAVDIAAALFHLWTARGAHLEVMPWANALFHVDDPLARRRSTLLAPTAAQPTSPAGSGAQPAPSAGSGGQPALPAGSGVQRGATVAAGGRGQRLPDADRLAWVCLFVGLNGGIAGSPRLVALAWRAVRRLIDSRPGEISARATALASVLRTLGTQRAEAALTAAAPLVADPDPYVQGMGLLLRAALLENQGMTEAAAYEAELAYHRFEAIGDHWGMGMAAQGLGEWSGSRGQAAAPEWLRRGVRHLELVGAERDVWTVRVQLDVQLAIGGDRDAEARLRAAASSAEVRPLDVAQAHLGLSQVAWQFGRFDEALAHAELAMAVPDDAMPGVSQARTVLRVVAVVLHLRADESAAPAQARVGESADPARARPGGSAGPVPARVDGSAGPAQSWAAGRAAGLLALARGEVFAAQDVPVVGSWALGGAVLAAHRGEVRLARELWTGGLRLGSNVLYLFQRGHGERLTTALGDEEGREPLRAAWGARSVAEATERIRELMDDLLG